LSHIYNKKSVGQAIRLHRPAFDAILAQAVHSKYIPEIYEDQADWNRAVKNSDVRLQWDPDHSPTGDKLTRRAIQLGLQGETAIEYAQEFIVSIEDISEFVAEQRQYVITQNYNSLLTPSENPYLVSDAEVLQKLQLS
jgi:hypothetical protein